MLHQLPAQGPGDRLVGAIVRGRADATGDQHPRDRGVVDPPPEHDDDVIHDVGDDLDPPHRIAGLEEAAGRQGTVRVGREPASSSSPTITSRVCGRDISPDGGRPGRLTEAGRRPSAGRDREDRSVTLLPRGCDCGPRPGDAIGQTGGSSGPSGYNPRRPRQFRTGRTFPAGFTGWTDAWNGDRERALAGGGLRAHRPALGRRTHRVGAAPAPGQREDARDLQGHPGGRPGLSDPPVQRGRRHRGGDRHRSDLRGLLQGRGPLPDRCGALRRRRLHRHEHLGARQPAHRRGCTGRRQPGAQDGLPRRFGHRPVRGRIRTDRGHHRLRVLR